MPTKTNRMIIEDLLQKVLHDRRVNDLIKEDGRLWNAVIEFAEKYHEHQVKSVDLADVGERKPTYNDRLRDEIALLKEKRDAALGSTAIRYWEREIKRVKKKLYG